MPPCTLTTGAGVGADETEMSETPSAAVADFGFAVGESIGKSMSSLLFSAASSKEEIEPAETGSVTGSALTAPLVTGSAGMAELVAELSGLVGNRDRKYSAPISRESLAESGTRIFRTSLKAAEGAGGGVGRVWGMLATPSPVDSPDASGSAERISCVTAGTGFSGFGAGGGSSRSRLRQATSSSDRMRQLLWPSLPVKSKTAFQRLRSGSKPIFAKCSLHAG
mmetsp:Transcript_34155/g.61866  ORF Transcript_34155/g.61866 Transcript_34155/m.61866 type:complete len:223 (-) Transcript_34155:4969-5637(-)